MYCCNLYCLVLPWIIVICFGIYIFQSVERHLRSVWREAWPALRAAAVVEVKQSPHWHDKGFTPWHAIWRANEIITCDSVRGDALGCVGMRVWWSSACHVVAKIVKCSKQFSKVSRLVATTLWSTHAWHRVSLISWTVHNLCVTDGATWRNMAQNVRHFAVLTDLVPLKCHDLSRHIAGHCGNKIRASVRLALPCARRVHAGFMRRCPKFTTLIRTCRLMSAPTVDEVTITGSNERIICSLSPP